MVAPRPSRSLVHNVLVVAPLYSRIPSKGDVRALPVA